MCLAAGVPPPESDGLVQAAVAVELVHAATLVHDDVLDGSALRRGRPTVVASAGRRMATATGDLLFARAFAELAGGRSTASVRVLSRASSELALGELMQRADAFDGSDSGRALSRALPPEDRRPVPRCVRAGGLSRWGPVEFAGSFRGADRSGVPDPRRCARCQRAAREDRQAPRRRSARRHDHAAADRGPRSRSRAAGARGSIGAHRARRGHRVRPDRGDRRARRSERAGAVPGCGCQVGPAGATGAPAGGARAGRRTGWSSATPRPRPTAERCV